MKSICIVGAMNIKHMSLISLYTKYLDDNKIPYDLIYMDRYGIDEKSNAKNKYRFQVEMSRNWSKGRKLLTYLKFRRYAKSIILKNNYDLIITWQTFTAYLLADLLLTKFRGKYIINIRDYIVENIFIIKKLLRSLVKKSSFTTISSNGFLEFLPKGNYTVVNSINEEVLQSIKEKNILQNQSKIKIGFVGNCRFFNENLLLINALRNDDRFELWYCGTNSDIFQRYAQENSINNLYTLPSFEPDETIQIISRFDIVNSIYGSDGIDNRTLLPIRLYTAIDLEIPLIVSSGSHLSNEVEVDQLGFSIESYQNLGNELYDYMVNLNRNEFSLNCSKYMNKAREENKEFIQKLKCVLY